jgi:hypothetical protein
MYAKHNSWTLLLVLNVEPKTKHIISLIKSDTDRPGFPSWFKPKSLSNISKQPNKSARRISLSWFKLFQIMDSIAYSMDFEERGTRLNCLIQLLAMLQVKMM